MAVEGLARRLLAADAALVGVLNTNACASSLSRTVTSLMAERLATVEVGLMVTLAVVGRPRSALRMLAAVGLVYVFSELLGLAWPRKRPFARETGVEALIGHTERRSFPSRHVASGLAMGAIGQHAHPKLGEAMVGVAVLLGVSRVAAGLHYPSDVVAGALLGVSIGRLLRP